MKRWYILVYSILGDIRKRNHVLPGGVLRHSHALQKEAQFTCCIEMDNDAAFIGQLSGVEWAYGLHNSQNFSDPRKPQSLAFALYLCVFTMQLWVMVFIAKP